MKTATTLEFRNAVRKYAGKKGLVIGSSWTNKTTVDAEYNGHRTVGFYAPAVTHKDAAKIEKKLNKKGLTAKTRISEGVLGSSNFYGYSGTYIRGTCVLA